MTVKELLSCLLDEVERGNGQQPVYIGCLGPDFATGSCEGVEIFPNANNSVTIQSKTAEPPSTVIRS